MAPAPYTGCKVPLQYYEYHTNPERWSDELRLASKPGGRFHWLGGPVLGEDPRQELRQHLLHAGTADQRRRVSSMSNAYTARTGSLAPAGASGTRTRRARTTCRPPSSRTSATTSPTSSTSRRARVHFHSDFRYYRSLRAVRLHTRPRHPCRRVPRTSGTASSASTTSSPTRRWCTPTSRRDSATAAPIPAIPQGCYNNGVPQQYMPDTLNNYELGWKTTRLNGRLLWNGAAYLMDWKNLQTIIYDVDICAAEQLLRQRRRGAHLRRRIEHRLQGQRQLVVAGGSASYTDSHLISSQYATFEGRRRRTAALRAVLQLERQPALRAPAEQDLLNGYCAVRHRPQGRHVERPARRTAPTASRASCSPSYSIMNLRLGLNPDGRAAGWRSSTSPISPTRTRSSTPTRATSTCARPPTSRALSACV